MLLPLRLNLQFKSRTYDRFRDFDDRLKNQIKQEDEEIMIVISAFIKMKSSECQ